MHDEARQLRTRHADLAGAVDRIDGADPGGEAAVCVTTTVSSYPATAAAYYAVAPLQLGGSEAEGASASTASTGRVFLAYNLGSAIPPAGTKVLCVSAGGRWVFVFNG